MPKASLPTVTCGTHVLKPATGHVRLKASAAPPELTAKLVKPPSVGDVADTFSVTLDTASNSVIADALPTPFANVTEVAVGGYVGACPFGLVVGPDQLKVRVPA